MTVTPGPWLVSPDYFDPFWVTTADGRDIAEVYGLTQEEDEANARLIAEAPVMYETLSELVAILNRRHSPLEEAAWLWKAEGVLAKINEEEP